MCLCPFATLPTLTHTAQVKALQSELSAQRAVMEALTAAHAQSNGSAMKAAQPTPAPEAPEGAMEVPPLSADTHTA